jgi:glucuronate isomerase
MLPTWRPDSALQFDAPDRFGAWLERLEASSGTTVSSFDTFLRALELRHDFFHAHGCRLSDHGLTQVFAADYTLEAVTNAFADARAGARLSPARANELRAAVLYELAKFDHARGWVQQFHLGALRNNNSRSMRALGADAGFDSIGDFPQASELAKFLDRLDNTNQLAKTILYNLNPSDNELMAAMIGNFQDGTVAGKMQYGSAWWFLDQLDGMTRQLNAVSNLSLLSRFVGMLTDSRSFLSYSRHEYFRRLLCNLLGGEMERGLLPNDRELVGQLVRAVCYENALRYFNFDARGNDISLARNQTAQNQTVAGERVALS